MRGVAREQQAAEAHRLGDEAAQRRYAFLDRWTGDEAFARLAVEAQPELVPETLVRPCIDILGEAALEVIAAARRRAHRAERKAELVTHVDQFLRDRRRVGKKPKPTER